MPYQPYDPMQEFESRQRRVMGPAYQTPGAPKRKAPSTKYNLSPVEEESLTRSAIKMGAGGLAAVGSLLDLPGSMVRDVLGGENPLDQLLTPFSFDNRVMGRDLLRKAGLAGKKDTWGNAIGGFAVDVLTDPLTWILPTGALTKAGGIAEKAGVMGSARSIAGRRLGRSVGTLGPREAAVRSTFGELYQGARPAQREALDASLQAAGKTLPEMADEPLRGMFGFGAFGYPTKVMGTGAKAAKYAEKVDWLGRSIRHARVPYTGFQPINELNRAFNAKLRVPGGAPVSEVGQVAAREEFDAITRGNAMARKEFAKHANTLRQAGFTAKQYDDVVRGHLENIFDTPMFQNLPPEVQDLITAARNKNNDIHAFRRGMGEAKLSTFESPLSEYSPRYASSATSTAGRQLKREDIFKPFIDADGNIHAIRGETTTIKTVVSDPHIAAMIDGQFTDAAGVLRNTKQDISNYIRDTYGDLIPPRFGDAAAPHDRYVAMADWISKMDPAERASGFFDNHPLADVLHYRQNQYSKMAGVVAVSDMLRDPGILKPASRAANAEVTGGTIKLQDLLKELDLKSMGDDALGNNSFTKYHLERANGQTLDQIANSRGMTTTQVMREFIDQRVSKEVADDMIRFRKAVETPKMDAPLLKAFDNVTNAFKGFVTAPWPAFHTRNFFSGQFQNAVSGTWSLDSVLATKEMLKGGVIKGAQNYPIVIKMAAERGIQNITPQQATDLLSEVVFSTGMSHRFSGEAGARTGQAVNRAPSELGDFLRELPVHGENRIDPGKIGREFIGKEPGSNLNPVDIRGIAGRTESGFGPMKAGEELSGIVESFNRIAPLLHQLKKGIDPVAAAEKVGAAQVMYQSRYYTPVEQQLLKRLFPFYSFSSRVLPWTLRELSARPGGKLAQTIRGINAFRRPNVMTPDYVAETAAIPMGSSKEGFDRYLTGAGLMFEDPLSFLGGGVRGALLEGGSRLNPMVKGPLEWMTNQSFFQKGPMGGRAMEDLDPTIGRLLANVTGKDKPVTWPGAQATEAILGNSPLARGLTTARTITGPLAKPKEEMPWAITKTLLNLGTGVRVTEVSPGSKAAMLEERAKQLMKGLGGKTFARTYFPQEAKDLMTPQQLEEVRQLEALMHTLSVRAKERKAAKEKAKKK